MSGILFLARSDNLNSVVRVYKSGVTDCWKVLGVIPLSFLKVAKKVDLELNPTSEETASIVKLLSPDNILQASLIRYSLTNSVKFFDRLLFNSWDN